MKIETRRYIRSCLNGMSSAYRFARHFVSGNGQKTELSSRQLYESVFSDVVNGIFECTDRLDLDLIQLKPEHDLSSILGTREARDQLFIYLKEYVLPKYDVRNRLQRSLFDEQQRIIDCIGHVYNLVLEEQGQTAEI